MTNYETTAVSWYLNGDYDDGEAVAAAALEIVRKTAENSSEKPGISTLEQARVYDVAKALKEWFLANLPYIGGIGGDLLNGAIENIDWRELAERKLDETSETVS